MYSTSEVEALLSSLAEWARAQSSVRSVTLVGSAAEQPPVRAPADADILLVLDRPPEFSDLRFTAASLWSALDRANLLPDHVILAPSDTPHRKGARILHLIPISPQALHSYRAYPDRLYLSWTLRHRPIYGANPFPDGIPEVSTVDHINGDGGLRQLQSYVQDEVFRLTHTRTYTPPLHSLRGWARALLDVPFPIPLQTHQLYALMRIRDIESDPTPAKHIDALAVLWSIAANLLHTLGTPR